jgi:putative transposase
VVLYALYLYFLGLSFRNVSHALDPFVRGGRSHAAVWKWVQRYGSHRVYDVKRVHAFLVDETYVQVGSFEAWVWVAVEPVHRYVLGVYLSRHQNIVAQLFLKTLVEKYGKHGVYSDGGRWYPDACCALGLEHLLHSSYEKSLVERANQYIKDRIEEFDDYWSCIKRGCDLEHVWNWLNLFVDMHYARRRHMTFRQLSRFLSTEGAP